MNPGIVKVLSHHIWIIFVFMGYAIQLSSSADSTKLCADENSNCPNATDISTKKPPDRTIPKPPANHNKKNYILVPPFLIGASTVIVLYVIFHCIYMHCYTEKKVKHIAKRVNRAPTIIIGDEALTPGKHGITPMVKMEGAYGKTELIETQPFLLCQPLDAEDPSESRRNLRRNSSFLKSLQIPNVFNSKKRPSVSSNSNTTEGELNSEGGRPSSERTRASICFLPVGKTLSDPSDASAEWTPLQGFVYTSFELSRTPSYKNACPSDTSVCGDDEISTAGGSYIILPRKASYCRSLSQSSCIEDSEDILSLSRPNGTIRQNSRVSFNLNLDGQNIKEEEENEEGKENVNTE